MSKNVVVTWVMNDGYAGGSRPQYTVIPRSIWDEEPEEDRERLIYDMVQEDFVQRGFSIMNVKVPE